MSVLGVWHENSDLLTSTVLASYDFNDYWQGTSALSYSNRSALDSLVLPSAKLSLFASLEFQF